MIEAISWVIAGLIALAIIITILARLYVRSTREVSLVRTGVGGRKVIMDGGTIAIPYFHEISRVNMQTLRLEVSRTDGAALITKDRMRVDVVLAFYISVINSEEGVARAAQTLGSRTFHPEKLRELIEGKLVDALRTSAANTTMDDLHENRGKFVEDIHTNLSESLTRNGLELDSVSLTALDQTPFRHLDEDNAFNAVGMRKLAEVIAKSKKERASIDADAEVAVRKAAMEASKQKLQIELEEQEAEIAQVQQIESLKASQLAEVVKRKAESEKESALARIAMEETIRMADIAREQTLKEAEIVRERNIEIATQERQIIIAKKSQEESKARGEADAARAKAITEAESILTAREVAEAQRRKAVAMIVAEQTAQASVVSAKGEAEATERMAVAKKTELKSMAEGQQAVIKAENEIKPHIASMKVDLAKVETMPKVVAEMVKPAEKIDSIKVHNISGFGANQNAGGEGFKRSPVNSVVDSIMDMAVQLPVLKKLGEELGLDLETEMENIKKSAGPAKNKSEK